MQPTQLPLNDIHLPETISWWPPAIGWWLVALFIPLLLYFLYWLYKRLTRKTAIKTAKKTLTIIKQYGIEDNDKKLRELSILIRRVAISTSPRTETASLTGREWLTFLDQSLTGSPFSQGCGQLLAEAAYRKNTPTEPEISQLISLCEDWLNAQTNHTKRKKKS